MKIKTNLDMSKPKMPKILIWELMCDNLICGFCKSHSPTEHTSKILSFNEVRHLIDNISTGYTTTPHINFIGDSFMRADFANILKLIKEKNIGYTISLSGPITNNKIFETLVKTKCSEIKINLYGPKDIHNSVVGLPNAFEKAIDTIQSLKKFNQSLKKFDIPILINCIITNDNISELDYMIKLSRDLNLVITFQHQLCPNNFTRTNVEKFKEFFLKHASYLYAPNLKYDEIDKYYFDESFHNSLICASLSNIVQIDPIGRVYPCTDYCYGNLLDNPLKEIWCGEKAEKFREVYKPKVIDSVDYQLTPSEKVGIIPVNLEINPYMIRSNIPAGILDIGVKQ